MLLKMIWIVAAIAALYLVNEISAQSDCPAEYLRFTKDHSFCKKVNPSCSFLAKGLQNEAEEIAEILEVHNNYRSKVATGQEKAAGGLPTASNMLELTWDKELQAIAQKWAEQCKFGHDCNECRATRSFGAGQNAAFAQYPCQGDCRNVKPNWKQMIAMFYNEVHNFKKELVKSVNFKGQKVIGHFTQVVWAKTWKIGCGFVAYKEGGNAKQLYICNYGPSGNLLDAPVYEEGSICNKCPMNSCCGDKCKGAKSYPGLCQLKSSPPLYPRPTNLLRYCDFRDGESLCEFDSVGNEKWELVKTKGGTFLSVVVPQQKYAMVNFRRTFTANNGFCIRFSIRKGPTIAGQKSDGTIEAVFDKNGQKTTAQVWSMVWPGFVSSAIEISWLKGDIKLSLKFSVPAGAPTQFLEIQSIEVFDKECGK